MDTMFIVVVSVVISSACTLAVTLAWHFAATRIERAKAQRERREFLRRPIEHPEDIMTVGKFAARPHPAEEAHVSQVRDSWNKS